MQCAFCRAQRLCSNVFGNGHTVQDRCTTLACPGDGAPRCGHGRVGPGSSFLPPLAFLHGCSEFVRHRFFIAFGGMRSADLLGYTAISLSVSTFFTCLPRSVQCCWLTASLDRSVVHTSDFFHEVLDKVLMTSLSAALGATTVVPMRPRGEDFMCSVRTLTVIRVHIELFVAACTQRVVAYDLSEGLQPLDVARCCKSCYGQLRFATGE